MSVFRFKFVDHSEHDRYTNTNPGLACSVRVTSWLPNPLHSNMLLMTLLMPHDMLSRPLTSQSGLCPSRHASRYASKSCAGCEAGYFDGECVSTPPRHHAQPGLNSLDDSRARSCGLGMCSRPLNSQTQVPDSTLPTCLALRIQVLHRL